MKIISVCFMLSVVVFAEIPNYITICRKGANLLQCLLDNFDKVTQHLAGNGEPAFQLGDLRNVEVEEINVSTGNLVMRFTNQKFQGLENIKLDEFTMTDKEIHMKGSVDRLEQTGDYHMDGQLLILPINGDGTMNITYTGATLDYTCLLKIEERNGKKYYHVDNDWKYLKVDLSVKKSYFDFRNLFGGDPRLGSEMNAFLNENQVDVYQETKKALEEGFVFHVLNKYINGYLGQIPIEDLFTQ